MTRIFRIHGDNIVECERIAKLILEETEPTSIEISLMSPSTIVYNIYFNYLGRHFEWQLELLPGFNKAGRRRWEANIFAGLKDSGSFLDETPDAIVTCVENGLETILYAIEFCSALQAGNQAWQRSGRAFSTGRTGCPYLYIVDFVKYELDARTRERKALRFPNPAVPYSYISFSRDSDNFVAQVYVRSEEFDKNFDLSLRNFDEDNFAEAELSRYIVKRMCGVDTADEEEAILQKNLNVVLFLASSSRPATNFTPAQWRRLYSYHQGIVQFSLENSEFNFRKTITAKGHHGNSAKFLDLVESLSVGLASRDLPFGIIPAANRRMLANGIHRLYPAYDAAVLNRIASEHSDLILCMIKGFKPRGDDNRPDRGILPLAAMLGSVHDLSDFTDIVIRQHHRAPCKALAALSPVNPQLLGKLISPALFQLICKGQARQRLELVTPKGHHALPEVLFAGILSQRIHSSIVSLSLCPGTDILCFSSFREVHTFLIWQIGGHGGTGQL